MLFLFLEWKCMEAAQRKRGDCAVLVLFSHFPSIIFCSSFTLLSNKAAKKSKNNKREGKWEVCQFSFPLTSKTLPLSVKVYFSICNAAFDGLQQHLVLRGSRGASKHSETRLFRAVCNFDEVSAVSSGSLFSSHEPVPLANCSIIAHCGFGAVFSRTSLSLTEVVAPLQITARLKINPHPTTPTANRFKPSIIFHREIFSLLTVPDLDKNSLAAPTRNVLFFGHFSQTSAIWR